MSRHERSIASTNDHLLPQSELRFGLLDIAIALTRNWAWLICLPLVMATIGYAVTLQQSKIYTSSALVDASGSNADVIMLSPIVLDSVLAQYPQTGKTRDEARRWLNEKVQWSRVRQPGAKNGEAITMSLKVSDPNPETAAKIANALVSQWITASKEDFSEEKKKIQKDIELAASDVRRLDSEISKIYSHIDLGKVAGSLSLLQDTRRAYAKDIAEFEDILLEITLKEKRQRVLSPPTMPDEGVAPFKYLPLLSGGVTALMVCLLTILSALTERMRQDPETRMKLNKIRASVGFTRLSKSPVGQK